MNKLPKHISITAISATQLVAVGHYGHTDNDGWTQVMYQASTINLPSSIVESIDASARDADPDFTPIDVSDFYADATGDMIDALMRLEGQDPSDPIWMLEEEEWEPHALARTRLILDDVRLERFRQDKKNGPPLDPALYYTADLSAAAGVVSAAAKECAIDHLVGEVDADHLTNVKAYRDALVQLAATAVAALECLDQWGTHPGSDIEDEGDANAQWALTNSTDEREEETPTA